MDKISLQQVGKRFKKDWVFRDFSYDFHQNTAYVIQGSNGSGKSTLLKLIASYLSPTLGKVLYSNHGQNIDIQQIHHHLSIAAPYMELPEEFTPSEILDFHLGFKQLYKPLSAQEFLDYIYLQEARDKPVNQFSSGMKQRLKLGLSICSQSDLLLLDEPTINLDSKGVALYQQMIDDFGKNRIIIVCSNNLKEEYAFCQESINVNDYKG